ncbi:DNA-binding FadR family transcriptional regulator [Silvimonas terrae]|uniref:DNA-binding FadR family transcriptional regulator n=1 Tax=Silvimonas terrae TaxID=300266 RepID=A0A840RD17_9NEIS|nr:FadR/GntR family transcriptional regulator [Silvimonas terrae]MBB5191235.1 DNA-binding FadR family transcriptional regulator [Silvimonas terrae]
MDLPTLKVERLYRQISSLIIQYIKDGRFKVGEALPAERDLAKQLGVGRSSVREALIALEIAGWVEIRTGTGVFVLAAQEPVVAAQGADVTSATALLEARILFEGDLAAVAAERATTAQIAALGLLLEEMANEGEENAAFHDSDRRFHWLIAEMTGNEVLQEMAQTLWNKRYSPLFQQLENHYGVAQWAPQVVAEHRAVHAAIAAHDPVGARAAMQYHLERVLDKLFRQT